MIPVTIDLILEIMRFPKEGPDPSQYFQGKDNDKSLVAKMKRKYDLERNGCAYKVVNINEWVVCITSRILSGRVV